MLLNDFFVISNTESSATEIWAEIIINANHKIFEGHFPNQPVVPGVCMMQMVKEILESGLAKATRLVSADHLKFLSVIDPQKNNTVHAETNYTLLATGDINVTARLYFNEITFFKFKGVFTEG